MEKRPLGQSDLAVSVFGLGTMTFGHESDEATSHAILDRYVEAGGAFIDTTDVYSRGISEEIIGRWLAKRAGAEGVEIATKARFAMSDDTERGVTMSQVALNWLRQRPTVSSVLLGCRTTEQLEDNLAALEWELTPEEARELNWVSAPGDPTYPQGFLEVEAGMDIWEKLETRSVRPY